MVAGKKTSVFRELLMRHLPFVLTLLFAIAGFYFTTRYALSQSRQEIQRNSLEIESATRRIEKLSLEVMYRDEFIKAKEDLIREMNTTNNHLIETNRRLDQFVMHFK